jgi:integrase
MARHAEGPKLYRDPRTEYYYVRFTHKGRRYFEPTREKDRGRAEEKKPKIYAEIVGGKHRAKLGLAVNTPIEEPLGEWIEAIEPELEPSSYVIAKCYATLFTEYFVTLGHAIDEGMIADFRRKRLREVKRVTVLKELSALRKFLGWCKEQGKIGAVPMVEAPPKNVTGTPDSKRPHKAKATKITEDEAKAIIDFLPEWSRRARRGKTRHRVRDFFIVLWETGLRPATVGRISAPVHYRKGATELFVQKEIDKARFERHVPLTAAAREALDRSVGKSGPVFGKHDYREAVANALEAAVAAKRIQKDRASVISIYDFRHGRTTDLVSNTKDLAAVAYIVGHKHVSTTSKYVEAPKESAARVLRDREKVPTANPLRIQNSGGKLAGRGKKTKRSRSQKDAVRKEGLEPS